VITAEIQGKGNYTGTTSVTYRVTGKILDLFKAKITLVKTKEYTGYAAEIDPAEDILSATITGGTLKYGENCQILYYENNVKKATARVTFIGMGECSGTKTVSFKIGQRNVSKHWYEALAEALGLEF